LILDIFLRTEEHLSSEDLYRLVKQEDPSIGQTTVYRTLKLLTEAGLAREVRFGDGITHYEHNYKPPTSRSHESARSVVELSNSFRLNWKRFKMRWRQNHRFQITQHLLRITAFVPSVAGR